MSHPINTQWVEAAYETFQEAVSQGNYDLARAVIDDTADKGFVVEALKMEDELHKQSVQSFIHPSPYNNL